MKISSSNTWLVDEEVSVLGTNNSQNLRIFMKILSQKFTFSRLVNYILLAALAKYS